MLFKNKYRIESARLKEFDYSATAWYYVTICTKGMIDWLGKIKNEKVELSSIGKIVLEEWTRTKEIRKSVELDEFVIMPNHLHGIIIINDTVETTGSVGLNSTKVETQGSASLQVVTQNLSNIIKGFKSATTFRIRKECNKNFSWQPRFYDHVIRNEKSLYKIRNYIQLNPLKWEIDEYYRNK
ncbi:MAG: transposase [Melioribacter sp.]|nr:transposase [Melioribacter sp.]